MTLELNALSGARPVGTRYLSFQGTQLHTSVLTRDGTRGQQKAPETAPRGALMGRKRP